MATRPDTGLHCAFNRRDFLGAAAATGVHLATLPVLPAANPRSLPVEPFVGVHIAAHSFYDEGFEHCLDFLQQTAAVNALFVTNNSYYGAMFRPKEAQGDHGVPIRDGRGRKVTSRFFKPNESLYANTPLRHKAIDPSLEYAGREILADLAGPARKRGVKIYERLYEPGADGLLPNVANAERVLTVDIHGQPGKKACWNNPDYLNFVDAWVRDLFSTCPLDGIQYGAERCGPLSRLVDWADEVPTCFCDCCRERALREGVDFERAKLGLAEMARYIRSLQRGGAAGADGALVGFLRILMQFPEIFAWEQLHYRAGEELHQRIFDAVKQVNPHAQVGRHIDHAQCSWDIFYRAAMPYSRMARSSDFLKLSTYHDILGPRLTGRVAGYRKHFLRELSAEQTLALFYAVMGHNLNREPSLDKLAESGLSPDYVYRETKRAVDGVAEKCAIYAGIAIDIPIGSGWGSEASPSDPEEVYQCVRRAYDAGAAGIVICREYEEMREPSLRAIGTAVRERTAH